MFYKNNDNNNNSKYNKNNRNGLKIKAAVDTFEWCDSKKKKNNARK